MSQIEELRDILVGGNSEQLAELKARIEDIDQRTSDVAEVLAPAIDAGVRQSDDLAISLAAPLSTGLKRAIRAEPDEYAEILYPVMAPAIRRAISQAISSLMVTINQTMSSATSSDGLGLRLKSWRTGVPYAQLALSQSMVYRVVHLYLIDRDSGMMVAESRAEEGSSLDSDAVSAMFSAIQSFVQDSFSQNVNDRLTDMKVGGYNVWVAHGAKMMLACVIDGDAPERLKTDLYNTLDRIRGDYATAIADFDGDTREFVGVEERLKPLMQSQLKQEFDVEDSSAQAKAMPLAVTLLLSLVAGYFIYTWVTEVSQQQTVEHYLRQTPGVAVTSTYWDGGTIVVEGLQDPDAEIPHNIFKAHNIKEEQLQFNTIPFRSLETDMEMLRFSKELNPPAEISFMVDTGKIWLIGEAPITWLLENDARLRQLGADKRLQLGRLKASGVSVRTYIGSRFAASDVRVKEHLFKLFTNRPWVEVALGNLAQPF